MVSQSEMESEEDPDENEAAPAGMGKIEQTKGATLKQHPPTPAETPKTNALQWTTVAVRPHTTTAPTRLWLLYQGRRGLGQGVRAGGVDGGWALALKGVCACVLGVLVNFILSHQQKGA